MCEYCATIPRWVIERARERIAEREVAAAAEPPGSYAEGMRDAYDIAEQEIQSALDYVDDHRQAEPDA